jgi:hypothetical protein
MYDQSGEINAVTAFGDGIGSLTKLPIRFSQGTVDFA